MPEAHNADGLAVNVRAHVGGAIEVAATPHGTVSFADALGEREHHPQHMLGYRFAIPACLVQHQHAGCGAILTLTVS